MTDRISNISMYVLIGIGIVVFLLGVVQENYSPMLYFSYVLTVLAGLGWLGGIAVSIAMNPSSIKSMLIWGGAFIVVLAIGYGLASGEVLENYPIGTSEQASKLSGMGLYVLYLVFIGAIGSVLFAAVWGTIRK